MNGDSRNPMRVQPLWWLGQAGLILVGSLFLLFGVQLLMAAYDLPDPFTFIMTFFAACLIILISLALLAGFLLRLWSVYRYLKAPPVPAKAQPQPPPKGPIRDDEIPAESQER
ncbi:MAG: hypothetical protein P8010_04720 [Desulfosarcinaceae bacterium]|jgi:hypothetical protein